MNKPKPGQERNAEYCDRKRRGYVFVRIGEYTGEVHKDDAVVAEAFITELNRTRAEMGR